MAKNYFCQSKTKIFFEKNWKKLKSIFFTVKENDNQRIIPLCILRHRPRLNETV